MKIEKQLITPNYAAQMLRENISNRPVNKHRVYRYSREMKEGKWKEDTGELIKIGNNGRLLDGQHRLQAIIHSGRSIYLHIATGLNDDIFKTIDVGKPRSAADIFKIAGIKYATAVSSILQLHNHFTKISVESKQSNIDRYLTAQELMEIYYEDAKYWDDLTFFTQKMYSKFQKVWNTAEIGAFTALFDQIDINMSRNFIRQVCEGVDLENDSIIVLRNKLIADRMNLKNKMIPVVRRAIIVKTWNAFYKGDELKVLRFNQDIEGFPKIAGMRIIKK